jgi:hypothetical protein
MGYEKESLEPLIQVIKKEFINLSGVAMLELGNQEIYGNYDKVEQLYAEYGYKHTMSRRIVKPFFEYLGMRCTQIDYNGMDGALNYDVRNDITHLFNMKFKVLTNIGFTEHVGEGDIEENLLKNQYSVFKNLHELGEVGSIYYHCVPLTRYWYRHGVCDYSLDFFSALCASNQYYIIKGPYEELYHPEKQAAVFYKKINDSPFMTLEQFSLLPGLRSTSRDYNYMKSDQAPSFETARALKGVFVEIGTWDGGFSFELLKNTECEKLYCVDPYKHFEDSSYPDGMNSLTQEQFDNKYNSVIQKFSQFGSRVEFIRSLSKEASARFDYESIDFVYIDGNHEYKYVLDDIITWFPKVKYGGYLCGDDVYSKNMDEHDADGNITVVWNRDSNGNPMGWGKYGTFAALLKAQKLFKFTFTIDQTQFIIHKQ